MNKHKYKRKIQAFVIINSFCLIFYLHANSESNKTNKKHLDIIKKVNMIIVENKDKKFRYNKVQKLLLKNKFKKNIFYHKGNTAVLGNRIHLIKAFKKSMWELKYDVPYRKSKFIHKIIYFYMPKNYYIYIISEGAVLEYNDEEYDYKEHILFISVRDSAILINPRKKSFTCINNF